MSTILETEAAFRADFANGLKLDFSGRVWGGKGWVRDPKRKGAFDRAKDREIRIHKAKPVKAVRNVKPAIADLASEHDCEGRTVEDHHAMILWYAELYERRQYPLSGQAVTDPLGLKTCEKPYTGEPLKAGHNKGNASEGLDILMKALKGTASIDE